MKNLGPWETSRESPNTLIRMSEDFEVVAMVTFELEGAYWIWLVHDSDELGTKRGTHQELAVAKKCADRVAQELGWVVEGSTHLNRFERDLVI